jgi:hypothetical protein
MSGGLESIMQGVITQGTALQSKVRQTSQDIIADAYEQYTGSSSARIANSQIELSENVVDQFSFGSSLFEDSNQTVSNTVNSSVYEENAADTDHVENDDHDDDEHDCCHHRGWERDDHPGRGRAVGRDHGNDDTDKHCDNDGKEKGKKHHCD